MTNFRNGYPFVPGDKTPDPADKKLSPWQPMNDPVDIKIIGKLIEELGELQAILARALIQGMGERDPDTGVHNYKNVADEIADVRAGMRFVIQRWSLPESEMTKRAEKKYNRLIDWHYNTPNSWTLGISDDVNFKS